MCYRVRTASQKQLEERFNRKMKEEKAANYQPKLMSFGYDFPLLPIITSDAPDVISVAKLGLIPSDTKDEEAAKTIRKFTLNARSEEVHSTNSYKKAYYNNQFCWILVDGLIEHRWKNPEDKNSEKFPYLVSMKDDQPFAIAGLYDIWRGYRTITMLTTEPNELMRYVHNKGLRMPGIMVQNEESLLLDRGISPADKIKFVKPFPDGLLKAHTISKAIASPKQLDKEVPALYQLHPYDSAQIFQ